MLLRRSLFQFMTHAQLFLFIPFSLLFLLFLLSASLSYFSSYIITTFLPFYFSSYDSHQVTGRQNCYCALETKAHYSYCRCEGPATFSETFLSGPPRSGLSALSTASSSSTKTWETFSSQRSSKNCCRLLFKVSVARRSSKCGKFFYV